MDRRDARAWCFLSEQLEGRSTRQIARGWRVSVRTVQAEASRVRRQLDSCSQNREFSPLPVLVPFFPVAAYTPQSSCNHAAVPIPRGQVMCCGICWRSGMDHHPRLARDPRTDPKPDPKPQTAAKPRKTRRQRRERAKDLGCAA